MNLHKAGHLSRFGCSSARGANTAIFDKARALGAGVYPYIPFNLLPARYGNRKHTWFHLSIEGDQEAYEIAIDIVSD